MGLVSGETLSSVMSMDIKKLLIVYRAYLKRREINLNDYIQCGHTLAAKQAQAFTDVNSFSEPIKHIEILNNDDEISSIVEMANGFNMKPEVVRKQILKEVLPSE